MEKHELIEKLDKDIKVLKNRVKYYKIYNIKAYLVSGLIKSGIILDVLLPYLLSGVVGYYISRDINRDPFKKDELYRNVTLATVYSSDSKEVVNVYDNPVTVPRIFQYQTKWFVNDKGLYEKTIISYAVNNLDNYKMEDILELSKEQLEEMFIITNIKTIEKEKLTKDDINNNKDMVIISKVTENVYIKDGKKQSTLENTADIMTYLIMTMFAGHGLSKIEQLIFHDEIKNKLKNIEYKFIPLNECDLNNLKIIIDMKEQNLELLRDSSLPKVRTRSKR